MPSVVQGPCPAAPFRMPGSGLPQVHGLAAVTPLLVISFAYARLLRATNARPPSACPVAVGARFSRTKVTLADFCNLVTTHEHTLRAFQSSHASGALAPLHAGTNRCRLRWPCDASPHRGPVSRNLLKTACARRDPLAWTRQSAGRDRSRKGKTRALWTISRVPFSLRPGHPGRRLES
jgi:hypothetical protein